MMGIFLMGLVGAVAIVVTAPLAVWGLWMETLRDRQTLGSATRGTDAPPSCRPGHHAFITARARCLDSCRPTAHREDAERDEPQSFSEPVSIGA